MTSRAASATTGGYVYYSIMVSEVKYYLFQKFIFDSIHDTHTCKFCTKCIKVDTI